MNTAKIVLIAASVVALISDTFSQKFSAGGDHTLVVCPDGRVLAWGSNSNGQLGNGTTTGPGAAGTTVAEGASGSGTGYLENITDVSAGSLFSMALRNDGTVWTWGNNSPYGNLGNNTLTDSPTPVQVVVLGGGPLTGIIAISAGDQQHAMALKNDGTVWAWGSGFFGQLGQANTADYRYAVKVKEGASGSGTGFLENITAIAAGMQHSVALRSDGLVWAWGRGDGGQLGNGSTSQKTAPVQVNSLTGITSIAAGGYSASAGYAHSMALKSDGTVWMWGYDNYGQLGDGSTTSSASSTPSKVVEGASGSGTGYLENITAISTKFTHALALRSDGTVWAWGRSNNGQLGDNQTAANKPSPVQVLVAVGTGITTVSAISVGDGYSLAIKNNGEIWAWGNNSAYRLADGTTTQRNMAVQSTSVPCIILIPTSVELLSFNADKFNIISIHPNPAINYIEYLLGNQEGADITVKLYDALGRVVFSKEETIGAGLFKERIETQNFASGNYLLRITNGNKEKTQKQFVIK